MRKALLITISLLLADCGIAAMYQAEIISGNQDGVSIKSGERANPGTLASEHCATYGKKAVLTRIIPISGTLPAPSVYTFDCVSEQ